MRIAILTNFNNGCTKEDFILASSFSKDGHKADLIDFPMVDGTEDNYDIIILKNSWDLNENTYKNYFKQEEDFFNKMIAKNKLVVSSLDGKLNFRENGKRVLVNLFKKGYNVVPSICNIEDFALLPQAEKYIKKPITGYDGFDMEFLSDEEAKTTTLHNEILQPKLKFISEVQVYFINEDFQYAFEYKPSKWPDYPRPTEISLSESDIEMAKSFIKLDGMSCAFYRIDFLKLENNKLILLEMADTNPNLSIPYLSKDTQKRFLNNFKNAVYKYIQKNTPC